MSLVRTITFSYSAVGDLVAVSDPAATYSYSYDGLGRVTSQGQTIAGLTPGITYASEYDELSRRTELLASIGGDEDFLNTFTYDNLSRLTRVQQGSGEDNVVAEKRFDFAYNAASQYSRITRYADLAGTEFVANTFYAYDGMGRLAKLLHTVDGSLPGSGWGTDPLVGYAYTYDAASRIASIDSLLDGLTEYGHDDTNQLIEADHTSIADENYEYDENGNRTGGGYSTGDNNQFLSNGTYNYTYDDEGNRLTRTKISDGYVTRYEWDHRNRLVSVTEEDDEETVLSTVEHSYDAFNRWVRRVVDADGPGGDPAEETFFSWEADQINQEFAGDDAADLSQRYLWNPAAIDQILAVEDVASLVAAGDIVWPFTDHLGTPRDLGSYDDGTNETTIENHRIFDSFGILVSQTNGSFTIAVGFTGVYFDVATGLNYHRNRWFDMQVGRWISEDPIGFGGDSSNLYRYVGNRPAVRVDPTGYAEFEHKHGRPSSEYDSIWTSVEASYRKRNTNLSALHYFILPTGTLTQEAIAIAYKMGLTEAASFLSHYQSNKGGSKNVDMNRFLTRDQSGWDWAYELAHEAAHYASANWDDIVADGGRFRSSMTYTKTTEREYGVLLHRYGAWIEGSDLTTKDGLCTINITYQIDDVYDFDIKDKGGVGIPGLKPKLKVADLAAMHEYGAMRAFRVGGKIKLSATWKQGNIETLEIKGLPTRPSDGSGNGKAY